MRGGGDSSKLGGAERALGRSGVVQGSSRRQATSADGPHRQQRAEGSAEGCVQRPPFSME